MIIAVFCFHLIYGLTWGLWGRVCRSWGWARACPSWGGSPLCCFWGGTSCIFCSYLPIGSTLASSCSSFSYRSLCQPSVSWSRCCSFEGISFAFLCRPSLSLAYRMDCVSITSISNAISTVSSMTYLRMTYDVDRSFGALVLPFLAVGCVR